jgi:6,7-dimethyl-8-ribityllumazine synthase
MLKNIQRTWAPGSFELPFAAKMLADYGTYDAIICIGCLVKGETMHFEYIAEAVSNGVMKVQLDSGVPCLFGVLTVMNLQQAIVRSTGEANEGISWGNSVVEMGLLRKRFQNFKKKKKK